MMLGGGAWGVGFMALGTDTNITSSVKHGEVILRLSPPRLMEWSRHAGFADVHLVMFTANAGAMRRRA